MTRGVLGTLVGGAAPAAFLAHGVVDPFDGVGEGLVCHFGDVLAPREVCAERDLVPGALGRALRGDASYLEP
ncbi:MAG: hypothetical protein HY908_19070 [Myxococcales bacterium]|nr:hypothetical protein [Myxococcales bacterium]